MRNLKGKKVKMLPHCLFYRNDGGSNIGVIHKVVDVPHWNNSQGNTVVMVTDGAVMMACYPHELRYLNNKPVVFEEARPKPLGKLVKIVASGKEGRVTAVSPDRSEYCICVQIGDFTWSYLPSELRYLNNREVVLDE